MAQQNDLEKMREKETDELLEIWNAQDIQTWTPEALDAARTVLTERLGSVPPSAQTAVEVEQEEEDADLYHEPKRLLRVADLVNKVSWVILVLALINGVGRILFTLAQSPTFSMVLLASGFINALSVVVDGIVYWGLLQVISEAVYLGMDIEFNGRKSSRLLANLLKKAK